MALNDPLSDAIDIFVAPSPKKQVQPLPYGAYFGGVLGLCIAGLLSSVYLAVSHYRVHTDVGFQSFCALSKNINCDTVSQSPFSVWWGLPLAVWGVAAYTFMLILVLFSGTPSAGRRRVWTISLAAAFGCSLASVVFAGLSAFKIGSYCIMCIATYGINFFLVFLIWIIRRRFQAEALQTAFARDLRFLWANRRWSGPVLTLFGTGLMLTAVFFPAYWNIQPPGGSAHIKTGLTDEGHPWIGAENPELEIVEFTDYQCFQCRKMHYYLLQVLARYPGKIRLVHRHFPVDHEFNPIVSKPFHVGSGRMALLAIHAAYNGKFAEMTDWLFFKAGTESASIKLAEAAAAIGMDAKLLSVALQHEPYRWHLMKDIRDGLKLGIVGTPSYLINGRIYQGNLPAEVLKPLMDTGDSD
jgi:protein-disulfide isomerase/uncharacterized membrane protein